MRRISVLALALGLAPVVAYAQATPPTQPPPPGQPPGQTPQPTQTAPAADIPVGSGIIDFSVRGTSVDGDAARYERYRDLGDGLALEVVRLHRERGNYLFDFGANHVARNDQRYRGDIVNPGKLKAWAMWDQIPMLMSRTTQTLFADTETAVFQIDDALQQQVQANPAVLPTLFDQNARTFETESRRHIFESGADYLARPDLTIKGLFRYTNREGGIPYGGSFGHSSLVEMPVTVRHNTSEFDAGAEYSRDPLLLRFGYTGSWFTNDTTEATFDSPFRATDSTSNSSRGRLSLAPSNSFVGVNGTASVKLPYRSRATAYLSFNSLSDAGDPLMPQTVNTATSPLPVDRATVEGDATTTAVNLTFTSRPHRYVDINARFRNYDYDNNTPVFTMPQRVSYDNSPGNATYTSLGGQVSPPGSVVTEPHSLGRSTFDADVRTTPRAGLSVGAGYTYNGENRTHRVAEDTSDNIFRLTFDALGHPMYSLRTKYEHARRSAEVTEDAERELFFIGEQPGMRHYDVAARSRNRITLLGTVIPSGLFSLNASFAAGKDDYDETEFGLLDNTHQVYGFGFDAVPRETVTLAGSYSYERYNALSQSRQADPPGNQSPPVPAFDYDRYQELAAMTNPGVQVADVSRNWSTDHRDRAHTFIATAHFARIAEKWDVNVMYDFSLSRSNYDYNTGPVPRTLPEDVVIESTLPPPEALPPTRSELQRATFDVMYALTPRISVGMSYWFERYRVEDFTLDLQANPDLTRGNVLLLGYLYEPYTANTVWARILYRW